MLAGFLLLFYERARPARGACFVESYWSSRGVANNMLRQSMFFFGCVLFDGPFQSLVYKQFPQTKASINFRGTNPDFATNVLPFENHLRF